MNKSLIIQIPYGGLGDHLFHSHLPRIAKETGAYNKVYISKKSLARHNDYLKIAWETNPYIDGFVDDKGISCDLDKLVKETNSAKGQFNLLDAVMQAYKLDDNKTWHEPEIYYKPQFLPEYNADIYDPNFISWVGLVDKKDVMRYFKKHRITFDYVMKIRNEKALFIEKENTQDIETKDIFSFCNLIHSCNKLFCLTSGTATLAAALGKKAMVFYGQGQGEAFRHSKLHDYFLVKKNLLYRLKHKING